MVASWQNQLWLAVQVSELFGQLAANFLELLLSPEPDLLDLDLVRESFSPGFNADWMDEIQEGDAAEDDGLSKRQDRCGLRSELLDVSEGKQFFESHEFKFEFLEDVSESEAVEISLGALAIRVRRFLGRKYWSVLNVYIIKSSTSLVDLYIDQSEGIDMQILNKEATNLCRRVSEGNKTKPNLTNSILT